MKKELLYYMNVGILISTNNYERLIEYCEEYFAGFVLHEQIENCSIDMRIYIGSKKDFNAHYLVYLPEHNLFHVYRKRQSNRIYITNIQEKCEHEFMRLIRKLIIYCLAQQKCTFLHAACVAKKETAVAIIGDKFAGKTTTCLSLLKQGWDFVSNDKLIIRSLTNKNVQCWGLPIALGIREGAKSIFASEMEGIKLNSDDNRYYMDPGQLIERFKTRINNSAQLKLIIVPVYRDEVTKNSIEEVSRFEVKRLLKKQVLSCSHGDRKRMCFEEIQEQGNIEELIEIPTYKIIVNQYLNPELNSVIEEILKKERECHV